MLGNKRYTGIVLDGDSLKVANIEVSGKKISLISLDKIRLVEKLTRKGKEASKGGADVFGDYGEGDDTAIFGMDEGSDDDTIDFDSLEEGLDDSDDSDDLIGLDDLEGGLDDLAFDDLDDAGDEAAGDDMVGEAEVASSNELLLYNLLSSYSTDRVDLAISIPAGETLFQILKDVDFSETKKKDLKVIVDDRLEALHGSTKTEDYYSYTVRSDGALLLASVDDEPDLLSVLNKTHELYSGKLIIHDILPDEIILLGLFRANYDLEPNTITGVVQFGADSSRIMFLRGDQLWIVSPVITEGTNNKRILNTIFSKILFQLDTGEVPNLDQLIICNNSLGEEAVEFFEERFQDVDVSEFQFTDDFIEAEGIEDSSISAFTTAIGAAWAGTGLNKEVLPNISFLPSYVTDRQKIFKLQWHGVLLLLFIMLTPIVSNHFYTKNAAEIDRLTNTINSLDSQIRALEPTVQRFNEISSELEQIQTKLRLLSSLNEGTLRWSTNLGQLNRSFDEINSLWLTSLTQGNGGITNLKGYAIYKSRIPEVAQNFHSITLQNVSATDIREQEVYEFNYVIQDFFEDENIYTPQSVKGIQEIIQE